VIVVVSSDRTRTSQSQEGDIGFYPPSCAMSRIAFIAGTYLPESDSVSDYTARLHTSLRDRGVESIVLTTYYAAEAAYDPHALGVVHGWRWVDLKALVKAVWDSGADAVHIQYHPQIYGHQPAILLLPLLLRLSGWRSPIVTTVHEYGNWEWQRGLLSRFSGWLHQYTWWDREGGFLLTLSNATIAIAPEAKTLIQARLPNIERRLWHVPKVPNVQASETDSSAARQILRQTCNWHEDTFVITYLGFLHSRKELATLLLAFKQVLTTQPQARLLVMDRKDSPKSTIQDDNTYLTQLQTTIDALELHSFVHFTGYLDEEIVSRYLAGSDIGVLDRDVSLNNSSLMSLLSHGLPAIATYMPSYLPDTHPLLLVPPHDVAALTTVLIELIDCPEKRRQQAKASRAFSENFTWQNITQQHLEIYQGLFDL
jgi:polysaccharide biosynthesis protein PslF